MCESSCRKVYRVKKSKKATLGERFLVAWFIVIAFALPVIVGYYAGVFHAVKDTEVGRDRFNNIVLKLDGEVYRVMFEEVFN